MGIGVSRGIQGHGEAYRGYRGIARCTEVHGGRVGTSKDGRGHGTRDVCRLRFQSNYRDSEHLHTFKTDRL